MPHDIYKWRIDSWNFESGHRYHEKNKNVKKTRYTSNVVKL